MFKIKLAKSRIKIAIKSESRPDRAWRWLASVFLLAAAAALAGGYLLYHELASLEAASRRRLQSQNSIPQHLDEAGLRAVADWLDAKAARTEELKTNPPTLRDPAT
ncbi:MAG: hypothetical protein HY481_02375 [Candidatus Vogelbacteria bacterium]|nr:hypothetical protein [Candidatus Vogelbacteria bacterium]